MSESIIPIKIGNTSGINNNNEVLRLKIITALNNGDSSVYEQVQCFKEYLESSLVPDLYEYKYVSKIYRKNAIDVSEFTETELIELMMNNFQTDCINVLLTDIYDYAINEEDQTLKIKWLKNHYGLRELQIKNRNFIFIRDEFIPALQHALAIDA